MSDEAQENKQIVFEVPVDISKELVRLLQLTAATDIGHVIADALYLYSRLVDGALAGCECYLCEGDKPVVQFSVKLNPKFNKGIVGDEIDPK